MEKLICEVCGKEFEYDKLSSCRAQLTIHLKMEHKLSMEEYQTTYILKGDKPKCLCGCGNYVSWNNKNWCWNKYFADSHVGKVNSENAAIIKEKMLKSRKIVRNLEYYYKTTYDENIGNESIKDFLTKEYTLEDLEIKYRLDRRTLKKMWFELKLIEPEVYNDIINYLKYNLSTKKRKEKFLLNTSCYVWVYSLIKEFPQKYTIYSAIEEYNKNNDEKIINNGFVFYKQLKDMYGDEIDLFLMKGTHSKEEFEFYNILKFFLPNVKIKIGYKITNGRYDPIYDMCLNDKYIIEYDSKGQFHKTNYEKEKDSLKEKIAMENGFNFKRLTYDEIHNINIIKEIKVWLNL